jgi:hypothetical protein
VLLKGKIPNVSRTPRRDLNNSGFRSGKADYVITVVALLSICLLSAFIVSAEMDRITDCRFPKGFP